MNGKPLQAGAGEEEAAPSTSHADAAEERAKPELNYGPGWTGIAVLALSTLASVLLVWQGKAYITGLEEDSRQVALQRLAVSMPEAICVDAAPGDVSGLVSNTAYLRCDPQPSHAPKTCPPAQRLDSHDRNATAAVFTALWECNATSGFYLTDGLYAVLAGQTDVKTLVAGLTSDYRTGKRNITTLAWFIENVGGPGPGPGGAPAALWGRTFVTGFDKGWLFDTFSLEQTCLPDLLHSYPGLLNGVWRIALGQQDFLYVGLQQDAATARCMHGALAAAGAYPDLCPQGQFTYLAPLNAFFDEYEAYNCTDRVDNQFWDLWTDYQSATHSYYQARFLGFRGSFSTILAIFTGATAGLFGAAVALVSHLIVAGGAYIPPPWTWPCHKLRSVRTWDMRSMKAWGKCPGCLPLRAHKPKPDRPDVPPSVDI